MLKKEENLKKVRSILRFFSKENEDGYLFAYAAKTALIPQVNKALQEAAVQKGENIGILFLEKYLEDADDDSIAPEDKRGDVPIIATIENFLKDKNYNALIIANLYEYIGDPKNGKRALTEINFAREAFYKFNLPILFWISEATFPLLSNQAADLYAQRRRSSIAFIDEQVTAAETTNSTVTAERTKKETARVIILKEQLEEAQKQQMNTNQLTINYLLPYLEELSENYQKETVLDLFEKHQQELEKLKGRDLSTLGTIFSNIHSYEKAIQFYSLFIDNEEMKTSLEVADALLKRGDMYEKIGDLKKALDDYQYSNTFLESLYRINPKNIVIKQKLIASYLGIAIDFAAKNNWQMTLRYYEQELKLSKELYKENPDNDTFKYNLVTSYRRLGDTYSFLGDSERAIIYLDFFLMLIEELCKANPDNRLFNEVLLIAFDKLGAALYNIGNSAKALMYFDKHFLLAKKLFKSNLQEQRFKDYLITSYSNLGHFFSLTNTRKALRYYESKRRLLQLFYKENKKNQSFKIRLADSYLELGNDYLTLGKTEKAIEYISKSKKLYEELMKEIPNHKGVQNSLTTVKQLLQKQ